uniref:NAD(+) ADP-ribosyltransferase n=1 Tax=Anticarsia gemmatalis multiple nucleopolyhedrovirus TaxID=268591 RepID=A0A455KFP8_9ABAC|nr:parp-like protein [Anticarsia gemmatalis multiple nucleopolyhedrovirus]
MFKVSASKEVQIFIKNCAALRQQYPSYGPAAGGDYNRLWVAEDEFEQESVHYYYCLKILERDGDANDCLLVQHWGAFNTVNHRQRADNLPLQQCLQKFVVQSSPRALSFMFNKIRENNVSKNKLPAPVHQLIAKHVFNVMFLKEIADEHAWNVRDEVLKIIKKGDAPETLTINTYSLINFYYKQLHTTINALEPESPRFALIRRYVDNSRPAMLKQIFEIARPADDVRYAAELGNRQLLWHGTSIGNVSRILHEGFKTSRAKASGMFGAGVYFSNAARKSKSTLLFLCEVALGEPLRCHAARSGALPDGKHSVHGVGALTPATNEIIDDNVLVPSGKLVPANQAVTAFDEFVIYNTSQIKMQYLIVCEQ